MPLAPRTTSRLQRINDLLSLNAPAHATPEYLHQYTALHNSLTTQLNSTRHPPQMLRSQWILDILADALLALHSISEPHIPAADALRNDTARWAEVIVRRRMVDQMLRGEGLSFYDCLADLREGRSKSGAALSVERGRVCWEGMVSLYGGGARSAIGTAAAGRAVGLRC